jgi:F-type H+-transporting ATPase subunit epsilon
MKFKLDIVTPERLIWSDDVDFVTIPTVQGEITILAHHVPIVTIIEPGELKIRRESETIYMAVSGGFIQVMGKKVTILADAAERAEEIDIDRAERAREQAKKLLSEKRAEKVPNAEAMAALQRSLTRLKVAGRRRKYNTRD